MVVEGLNSKKTLARSSVTIVKKEPLCNQLSGATVGKKLVLVLATSALVIEASKETQEVILDRVPCIHYPVQFRKDKGATIQALIDLGSVVNVMTLAYAKQVGLQVQKTDVSAQKIDGSLLQTFGMVIAGF